MILPILTLPDDRLRVAAAEVRDFYSCRNLAGDMIDTCRANNGLGLAATQVGKLVRLIVVKKKPGNEFFVLVNPTWRHVSPSKIKQLEGCFSIPGFFAEVHRYSHIEVSYQALEGTNLGGGLVKKFRSHGEMAMAYQHEIDHLDGKLFVDHLPENAQRVLLEKYAARRQQQKPADWLPAR